MIRAQGHFHFLDRGQKRGCACLDPGTKASLLQHPFPSAHWGWMQLQLFQGLSAFPGFHVCSWVVNIPSQLVYHASIDVIPQDGENYILYGGKVNIFD